MCQIDEIYRGQYGVFRRIQSCGNADCMVVFELSKDVSFEGLLRRSVRSPRSKVRLVLKDATNRV